MRRFSILIAALVLCMTALSRAQTPATQPTVPDADKQLGAGKVVGLDEFYNHQARNGKPFHYIWEDTAVSGYSKLGDVFQQYGATIAKLEKEPTVDDLNKFSVYIIVNPSTTEKAAEHKPNFIVQPGIDAIVAWVKQGGTLALFANDKNNCEFEHFNDLSQKFGITFNDDLRNEVPNARDRSPGTFWAKDFPDHPIFNGLKAVYMKEVCTLQVKDPGAALLVVPKEKGQPGTDIIAATAHVGKGLVFAIGDPWVYNEYIDVPATPTLPLENRKGAINLARWLLTSSAAPQAK